MIALRTKIHSLPVQFSVVEEVTNKDDRFIKVTIDVLHTGLNVNDSWFDKEVVDENIESIYNTAILGFIRTDISGEIDFKGHEFIVVKTDNGEEKKYLGNAYGVVPESCNPRWVTKETDEGEKEYLQVDGLLWSKFDEASEIILRDIEKAQSMELDPKSVDGYEDEDGIFHFTKFSFDGCCILGSNEYGRAIEPAMLDSMIQVADDEAKTSFSINDFSKNLQDLLVTKYATFASLAIEDRQADDSATEDLANNQEGGKRLMANTEYQTVLQQIDEISAALTAYETVKDYWGDDAPRYSFVDVQDSEVIAMDKSDWSYVGFAYSVYGDKVEIDFDSKVKKVLTYRNYEESQTSNDSIFGSYLKSFEAAVTEKLSAVGEKVSEAETNYSTLKTEYDELKTKYEEYVKAEEEAKAEQLEAEKDAMLENFETELGENEEFAALKESKADMSLEDIEAKCSIIYSRQHIAQLKKTYGTDFSKHSNSVGVPDIQEDTEDSYISERYGTIRK